MRALALIFAAALAIAPLTAQAIENHVWVRNLTDKSVWVTAFDVKCTSNRPCTDRHVVHEWCVPPANGPADISKRGFHVQLTVVHVLVTTLPNCGRPIIKEWMVPFTQHDWTKSPKRAIYTVQYNVIMHTTNGVTSYALDPVPL